MRRSRYPQRRRAVRHQGRSGIPGLTGVPVIALEGGKLLVEFREVPTLIAEPGAGQGVTQAARDALRKVDSVLAEKCGSR